VALKVVAPELAEDPLFRERFLRGRGWLRRSSIRTCCGARGCERRDDRTVSPVDPETGAERTFSVGETPTYLAVGEGSVWVADGRLAGAVWRIDAGTDAVVATIDLGPNASGGAVALGEGAVWVSGYPEWCESSRTRTR
jgi:hypothetical protein